MFAALVAGLTFFPKIPTLGGYVHLGDAVVYLAASFLPQPYALTAAAVGGGLADILSSYISYAPFSVVAKSLLTVAFTGKNEKILVKRNYLAPFSGLIITPSVYLLADSVLTGSFTAAIPNIIWNVIQAASSLVVYYIIGTAFDKSELKSKIR